MSRVLALTVDLMDRSRLAAAAAEAGAELTVAKEASGLDAELAVGADLVVVDLAAPDAIEAVAAAVDAGVRTIAYGAHVDEAGLGAARGAGAEALPRSRFFRVVVGLLSGDAEPPPS